MLSPVWRCERCNHWVHRMPGEDPEYDAPVCSTCTTRRYGIGGHKLKRPTYMWAAWRRPPESTDDW